jgi:hypothetical protein
MELFGLALSPAVALVASMLYCFFLDRVVVRFERPRRWLLFTSYVVLSFFAVELVMLEGLGAVRSSAILGRSFFYFVHLTLFFLVVPSLANFLLLNQRRRLAVGWYAAAFLCAVFAFFLALIQYSVSQSLYGIE